MKRIAAVAMLCLLAITAGCSKVPAGYTGVIVNLMGNEKGVAPTETSVGYKWLTWNEELFLFPTFNQNINIGTVTFQDKDGMKISTPIGMTLRAKPGAAPLLFQTYRKSMDEIVQVNVPQVIRTAFNNTASKLTAEEIYGPNKERFLKDVEARVRDHFDSKGIIVESLYLNGEIGLPEKVVAALNLKIEATQKTAQRQNEVAQVIAEADKAREEAKGLKDAAVLRAQGEAESLNIRGQALRNNPGVVELNAIEKWDGKLPVYMTSGSATPFIGVGK
ncbi:SPFH domain-containing protein [Pseudomonas chlororaphis]|uniref:SPFH domain-containing protein n=1 Tax=Pseudomonas chlororaphis TaxID=587753 RepID=UPI0024085A4F|nr:SPFH domain-containing protein [Pseudomonas chlororaphis]